MTKINEVIDSLNNENVDDLRETLISETNALLEKNNQLYHRAKKAEGFDYNKDSKEWIKREIKPEAKPDAKQIEKSNEPDYAKIAFLEQRGVTSPEDQKLVQEEADRLKMPLTDVLNFEHIKSKLRDLKDQREAQEGMPKGRGNSSPTSKGEVDYWVDKTKPDGTYETPTDLELASKVIQARIKKEKQANKFSEDLF